MEHNKFDAAASACVNKLATMLECDRVSLGLYKNKKVNICAISQVANFDKKSDINRALAHAMEEAIDQKSVIAYPITKDLPYSITQLHQSLCKLSGNPSVFTVPLVFHDQIIGALCFEQSDVASFDLEKMNLCKVIAVLVGPILGYKKQSDVNQLIHLYESLRSAFKGIFGPRHLSLKILATFVFLTFGALFHVESDYRVTSQAVVEGSIQRVITAPMDGFIASSNVVPGDIVKANHSLGKLDDKDLKLKYNKLKSKAEQLKDEYRQALGTQKRNKTRVLQAQQDQLLAQKKLIIEQLNRLNLKSPFNGVVIEGDLQDSLGAPVEKGQVLYKLASIDDYRVILKVDELDVTDIKPGQIGYLRLTGSPNEQFPIEIKQITPVFVSEEGESYFKIEAKFTEPQDGLLPGMTGIAKVEIGKKKILWIWTHSFWSWFKLKMWHYLP